MLGQEVLNQETHFRCEFINLSSSIYIVNVEGNNSKSKNLN